jgi:hypothetical protein
MYLRLHFVVFCVQFSLPCFRNISINAVTFLVMLRKCFCFANIADIYGNSFLLIRTHPLLSAKIEMSRILPHRVRLFFYSWQEAVYPAISIIYGITFQEIFCCRIRDIVLSLRSSTELFYHILRFPERVSVSMTRYNLVQSQLS